MEAKYYTPEIEEFHIGFECEIEVMTPAGNTTEYKKHTITEDDNIKELYESNDWYSTPRVKCLDRDDIESFEFKYDGDNFFHRFNNGLMYEILLVNGNVWIYFNQKVGHEGKKEEKTLFFGKIKNKSELKRVMIQNGIIEK